MTPSHTAPLTPESCPESTTQSIDINQFGPIRLLVIQPTSFCNLDCDYCYLPNRHRRNQLSIDLIEPIFEIVFSSRFLKEHFTICWHAGEPLSAPISFYRSAFAKIQQLAQLAPKPVSFNYSFQTNGLLLNQAWCDLFKQYPVHVGVSIDGPAFLHNIHRKTRRGLGSHAGALKGISLLKENGIPMSAIAVLTADSLDYPDEIFNFFVEQGITNVGFNMEETEGINTHSSLDEVGNEPRYRAFMERFWDLATQADCPLKVREFELTSKLIFNDTRLDDTDMNHPFRIVSVDYLGNFSTFDPELLSMPTTTHGDFCLGNISSHTFESVCQTPKFIQLYQEMKQGVKLCQKSCEYFGVCGGGTGSNKYWENGTFASTETQACRYRIKAVTNVVLDHLEQLTGLNSQESSSLEEKG